MTLNFSVIRGLQKNFKNSTNYLAVPLTEKKLAIMFAVAYIDLLTNRKKNNYITVEVPNSSSTGYRLVQLVSRN